MTIGIGINIPMNEYQSYKYMLVYSISKHCQHCGRRLVYVAVVFLGNPLTDTLLFNHFEILFLYIVKPCSNFKVC